MRQEVLHGSGIEVAADVADVGGVVDALTPVEVEVLCLVERCVEAHPCAQVPSAADVHGPAVADAGCGVVDGGVGDGATRHAAPQAAIPSHLPLGDVVVVLDVEVVVPRTFQSGVTRADVEGVTVVHDFDEVGHGGLRQAAVVADAQLAGVGYLPSEVEARCPVLHVANGVDVHAALLVLHVGALRLEVDAHVEVEFLSVLELAVVAEHEVDVLIELLVCGVLAVHGIACELGEVDAEALERHALVRAVVEVDGRDVGQSLVLQGFLQLVVYHHLAVAVLEAVLPLVAELHDGSLEDGFGVADAALDAVVL